MSQKRQYVQQGKVNEEENCSSGIGFTHSVGHLLLPAGLAHQLVTQYKI